MRSLRRAVTWTHRWLGLTVGTVVFFLAATGGVIAFLPQLNALAYPQLLTTPACTQRAPIDALLASARAAHPRSRPTYMYLYGAQTASAMIRFADTDQLYLNPCTTRVLGAQPRYGGLFGTFEGLHKFRFASAPGMAFIGTTALLVASLFVFGGLFMWWPRRKAASVPNLRLRGRALTLNLHTTIGLYASLVLFIAAFTALPLSLNWARSALFTATASRDLTEDGPLPALPPLQRSSAQPVSMEAAWKKARTIMHGPFEWASIRIPKHHEPIEIGTVPAGSSNEEARSYVYVDPRNGSIVQLRPYASLNAGSKLYYWALALHSGRVGGPVVQALMVLSMLALALIVYAGFDSYIRKALQRAAR